MQESYPNTRAFPDENVMDGGTDMESLPSSSGLGQDYPSESAMPIGGENVKHKATEALNNVRGKAERVTERVKSSVSNAQRYVQESDASDMWGDVKELARRNPGSALLTVAVLGFALGRSTSSRSR